MPFSSAFAEHPILERAVRVRRNRWAGLAVAVLLVGLAAFARWLLAGAIGSDGVPFITFYSAIILATFLGGLWPGLLAALLSSLIAWYGYLPWQDGQISSQELVSLLVFLGVSAINIGLVTVLNLAMDRVLAQHQNVRFLMDSAPNGIVVVDQEGQIKLVNARAEELFGYKHDELVGLSVDLLVPKSAQDAHRQYRAEFDRMPEARAMGAGRDLSGRRKDGSEFPVEIGLNPISREGRNAVLATVIDISERRQAQERQRFLVRELQHRTQNLFQVIRAVAEQSLADGQPLSEARTVLMGRLHALAQAHQALAEAAWERAHLDLILRRTLSSFRTSCTIEGCNVTVNTTAAQNFALIANELATNAAKYGALSVANGEVAIRGRVEQKDNTESFFLFSWQERGGPPVVTPKRKGFGTVILTELAKQFGQFVALEYEPHGLKYELRVPMSTLEPTGTDAALSTLRAARS
jgi:PAS domain S-box-containing protein